MNQSKTNYLGAFITMVILMALIGFITSINQQFQAPLQAAFLANAGSLTNTLATVLTFAFFLAYLVMGPTSARFLEKNGYKACLTKGIAYVVLALCIFECSALVYENVPSVNALNIFGTTLPLSYFIFVVGSFIAGTGLTYLQASVNPYLVVCDVKGTTGVTRQNIAGTGNSIMTTIGPLFIAWVVFGGKTGADIAVRDIMIPMAALIVFVAALYFVVKKLNLPDIAGTTKDANEVLTKSIWSFSHLTLGVIAIFFYVGVEVCIGGNFILFANDLFGLNSASAASWAAVYWFCMLVGRFASSFLSKIPANKQLLVGGIAAFILVVVSLLTNNMYAMIAVGLFHSVMWGAIFALAIEKLGKYTSKGSGALMMGVVGGAVLPFAQGVFADFLGSWYWTFVLVLIGEAYMIFYALVGCKVKQLPE